MPKYTVMFSRLVQIYYKPVEVEAADSNEAWAEAERRGRANEIELEEEGTERGLLDVVAVDGDDIDPHVFPLTKTEH